MMRGPRVRPAEIEIPSREILKLLPEAQAWWRSSESVAPGNFREHQWWEKAEVRKAVAYDLWNIIREAYHYEIIAGKPVDDVKHYFKYV